MLFLGISVVGDSHSMLSPAILDGLMHFAGLKFQRNNTILESGQRSVYYASEKDSSRKMVLKVCVLDASSAARMRREINILSSIDSIYFPKIEFYSVFSTDQINHYLDSIGCSNINYDNLPILITIESYIEHLDWSTCRERFRHQSNLVPLLVHLFTALRDLWSRNIVHRDIKPPNILIQPSSIPVLIDLGVAKSVDLDSTDITPTGFRAPCTPQFAAPEQLRGLGDEITYKCDQFAVGVVAYWLLTGTFPYGEHRMLGGPRFLANFDRPVESLAKLRPDIAPHLAKIIHRLIEPESHRRFRRPETILDQLDEVGSKI